MSKTMDLKNKEVPVGILVDIKEDEKFVCSHLNSKNSLKSDDLPFDAESKEDLKTKIQSSSNEECTLFSKSCPVALLVDVSSPSRFSFRDICVSTECVPSECFKDEPAGCKDSNAENHDSDERSVRNSNYTNDCKTEDSPNSSNSSEIHCQIPVKRLRWKTPSPQSMSRITKEASKVIDQLNSSSIFNEDLLLTEEMLPISLNFDEFDDADEKKTFDNVFEDTVFNKDLLIDQQRPNKTGNSDEHLNNSAKNESSLTASNKNARISNESCSSGIHSSSLGNSDSLTSYGEVDVINVIQTDSEDKENLQNEKDKENVGTKTAVKISSLKKSKLEQRGRLRNLSNIKPETSVKHLSVNKSITTPLRRMSISSIKNVSVPEKPQARRIMHSVDSHNSVKGFYQSKSNTVLNAQKLQTTSKIGSGCSFLSSDVKHQNVFATPSRRYSICTPMKSASAIKQPLTPAVNSSHLFAFPRYTPQPAKPSRLSFSRSWQHPGGNSQYFPEKGFKQQISTTMPSSSSKIEFGIKNSAKSVKLPFSQSMSAVSTQSLGKNVATKGKFSKKLPSPLTVDKKVVRALFTNVSGK